MNVAQSTFHSELKPLLTEQARPCLSLYLTTHRALPDRQQNPIRYKNLVKQLEESLRRRCSPSETDMLLDPFRALANDEMVWTHPWDGLAVIGAPDQFRVIKLHQPVPDLAIVADSFHLKPLLRTMQGTGRYQVLSLNRGRINLFEGNRDSLDEVQLAEGVPRTVEEALGSEYTDPYGSLVSFGGADRGSAVHHGQGSKKDEVDIDQERFFRAVDRAILEHHSKPSGLPLILAALAEYHTPFRRISHNSFLLERGIEVDASSLTADQLRERAWEAVEPEFRARIEKLAEVYQFARSKELGSDDLRKIAMAAAESRVDTLLVEADRRIPGQLNPETGSMALRKKDDPQADDLLDDLAELVLNRGGEVLVLPPGDMPAKTGVAAIYRF